MNTTTNINQLINVDRDGRKYYEVSKYEKVYKRPRHTNIKRKALITQFLMFLFAKRNDTILAHDIYEKCKELKLSQNLRNYTIISNVLIRNSSGIYNWNNQISNPNWNLLSDKILKIESEVNKNRRRVKLISKPAIKSNDSDLSKLDIIIKKLDIISKAIGIA